MLCPKCNTVNSDNEKYCRNCGFQLNASRICPQWGKVNQHNSRYCDECGATLSPVNSFKKDVISEGEEPSFFNKYKTALIAALILVLAIGAVTGIAIYGGNDNGGDDEPFFPLVNGNNSQIDDNTTLNDNGSDLNDNQTEDVKNLTDDKNLTNKSDNQAKSEKKTDKTNQIKSDNKTEQVKTDNKTEVKTDNKTEVKTDNKTDVKTKNKTVKTENKTGPVKSDNKTEVKTDNITQSGLINMNNKINDSNQKPDKGSSFKIKMKDVPNLAKEVADRNYDFSSIDYKGNSYSESQCIYIFSKYVLKINSGDDSAITVRSISKAPNPNAEDLSQEISKKDYISMARRIVSFIDNNNAVPNYVGISSIGPRDLSPDKLLYLYSQIVLNYGVTGDLPESVEI